VKKEIIRRLKEENSIIDVARDIGMEIKNDMTTCIYPGRHKNNDKHPSLYLNRKNNTFRCMVCPDISGDVITFLNLTLGFTFTEAIQYLAKRAGLVIDDNINRNDFKMPPAKQTQLNVEIKYDYSEYTDIYNTFIECCSFPSKGALKWITGRGISQNTIERMKIKYAKDPEHILTSLKRNFSPDGLLQSGLVNRIGYLFCYNHPVIWTYFKDDIPCYFQGRAIDEGIKPKEMNISKPIPFPYNIDILRSEPDTIIACEGVTDTLALEEHNYAGIGIIGVWGFKKEWYKLFNNFKVKVAFDADVAGQQSAIELVKELKKWGIQAEKVNLPVDYDINRFFQIIAQLRNARLN